MKDYYDLRVTQKEINDWGCEAAKKRASDRITMRALGYSGGEAALGTVKEGGAVGCGVVAGIGIANSWNPIGWGIAIGGAVVFGAWGAHDFYVLHQINVASEEAAKSYTDCCKLQ